MKDYNKIILDCYREIYKQSTPIADFDELLKNATTNERGEKEIPFNDYTIKEEIMSSILEKHSKKNKLASWQEKALKNTIYLGCSPKFEKVVLLEEV